MKVLIRLVSTVVAVAVIVSVAGCGSTRRLTARERAVMRNADELYAQSVAAFEIPIPTAPGARVEGNDRVSIDFSNTHEGYVVVRHHEPEDVLLKVAVTAPHGEQYIYALRNGGDFEVIPLAEGVGTYQIGVYENTEGENYVKVISVTVDVTFEDDHAPFLRPSQFVNYSRDSRLVILAYDLTKDAETTDEKISAIYNFVVDNFVYDYNLASTVESGYLPDINDVLDRKQGICFDYAALVTAMLRSQGIPTMLEIGYYGDEYHAWISVLCADTGWIDNRFHHNGEEWSMLDPTIESGERRAHVSREEAKRDFTYRVMFNY